jgi:hypothetical protein
MTKHVAAALLTALSMTAAPFILAPAAQAEVCGGVGGRYVDVGGCTHVGADIAGAAIVGAEVELRIGKHSTTEVTEVVYGGYGGKETAGKGAGGGASANASCGGGEVERRSGGEGESVSAESLNASWNGRTSVDVAIGKAS